MYKLTCTVGNGLTFIFNSAHIHDLVRIGSALGAHKLVVSQHGSVVYALTLH